MKAIEKSFTPKNKQANDAHVEAFVKHHLVPRRRRRQTMRDIVQDCNQCNVSRKQCCNNRCRK